MRADELLSGAAAIIVAIVAGIPVWRQLRDTNLQTRISHRERFDHALAISDLPLRVNARFHS